ncbi:MAG: diguanylate cyclase [Zoogloeaceae bacterium]|nr:diguanylate cyclase [Zoogloeaceae bacterium]
MKVLAVTGSSFFRHLLERHLGFLPEPLHFAESIADARGALAMGPDLICSERHLSDGTALDLARVVRREPTTAQTPVVLLTSSDDPDLLPDSLAAGITEVFSKVNLDLLAHYVEQRLRRQAAVVRLTGRALLVEDSKPVANFMARVLDQLGLAVDTFSSGDPALAALDDHEYEIALIDVLLEGRMTGLGLVRAIRNSNGPNADLPILAVSGLEDSARRIELLREGANDFLSKPMLEEELAVRVRNIVQIKRLLDQTAGQRDHLRRLALTDQLTGVYNRHYLAEIALRRIGEAERHGIPLTMLVLDIDHFKQVNDTHGHETGDVVLAETAATLRASCRQGDVIARTGGEEFVLLLLNMTRDSATGFAERLRQRIAEARPAGVPITVSIGIAATSSDRTGASFETLFKAADAALYQAKRGGRNRVVVSAD